jgi:hypothetical protein
MAKVLACSLTPLLVPSTATAYDLGVAATSTATSFGWRSPAMGGTQWDDALLMYTRVAPPPAAASSTAASLWGAPLRRLLAANGGGLGGRADVDDVSVAEAAMRDPSRLGSAFWSPLVRASKSLCRRCLMVASQQRALYEKHHGPA